MSLSQSLAGPSKSPCVQLSGSRAFPGHISMATLEFKLARMHKKALVRAETHRLSLVCSTNHFTFDVLHLPWYCYINLGPVEKGVVRPFE